jgi:tight adherence protein B
MLAVLCAAVAVMKRSRGVIRRDARFAKACSDAQMEALAQRQATAFRLPVELDDLMRRLSVGDLRSVLPFGALIAGGVALTGATLIAPVMALLALAVPTLCYAVLVWRARKRRRSIMRQLPSFLDGIVRLVRNGKSVPAAFQTAAASTQAPLSECLEQVMPRLRGGVDIEQALTSVARIYRVREFELIGAVLRISGKFGERSDLMLERMASSMRDDQGDVLSPCARALSRCVRARLPRKGAGRTRGRVRMHEPRTHAAGCARHVSRPHPKRQAQEREIAPFAVIEPAPDARP